MAPEPAAGTATRAEWAAELDLPDDVGLVARVVRLNMLVTRLIEQISGKGGLSPADYLVLAVVRRSPAQRTTPGRICEILGRSTGGLSLTIDRLEAAGLLTRTRDPADRRRVVVALTGAGLARWRRINTALHAWEAQLPLGEGERREAEALIDSLIALVTQPPPPPLTG